MKNFRYIIVLLLAFAGLTPIWAQTPVVVSPVTSTEGYDFFVTWLLNGNRGPKDKDLKLQIMITSETVPGHPEITTNNVRVEYPGGGQDVAIPVGTTQVVDITQGESVYIDVEKNEAEQIASKATGVHVYSKNGVKMTVYAGNKIGNDVGSTSFDGGHVLPKEALGYEYIVQCNANDIMATEFVIMSTVPGKTNVTVNIPEKVKTSTGKDGTLTVNFEKAYQIYVVRSQTIDPGAQETEDVSSIDLSGTTICSDQPIAVWSGNQAAYYPSTMSGSTDHAYDQLLPINHWGTQFVVPMMKYDPSLFKMNHMLITARDASTTVTVKHGSETQTLNFQDIGETKDVLMIRSDASDAGIFTVSANKPVQVYLHTPTAAANAGSMDAQGNLPMPGDASMTMIPPLEFLTDTTIFTTYTPPGLPAQTTLLHKVAIWARKADAGSVRLDNNTVPFAAIPGNNDYQVATVDMTEGTHIVTAPKKCFSGYVYGLANGQAYMMPIGYDFMPVQDSIFLADKDQDWKNRVRTSDWSSKYPDNGGWHLDKTELPDLPTQFDTVFVCDSTKLRFPLTLHNHWDEIKWEVMRIDQSSQKRTEYTDDADVRQTGDLTKTHPFIETQFFMLPERNKAPKQRHPYEDFEVRAVLYHKPHLCDFDDKEKWPKDTLNAIVRAFRIYRDTTWMIRCDNDPALDKFFLNPETKESQMVIKSPTDTKTYTVTTQTLSYGGDPTNKSKLNTYTQSYTTLYNKRFGLDFGCDSIVTLKVLLCKSDVEVRDPYYVCESDLADIKATLGGDFFKDYRLLETLEEHKKTITNSMIDQNKDFGDGWMYLGGYTNNLARTWQFKGTDVIRTTDCNPDMEIWHAAPYNASWPNNRPVIGCDKSLTIELHVLTVTEYEYSAVSCGDKYTWTYKVNNANNPKEETETLLRKDIGKGAHDVVRYYTPKSKRPGWEAKDCPTEKHTLHINFTDGDVTEDIDLCDDGEKFIVNKTAYPDIEQEDYYQEFDPTGKSGVSTLGPIHCVTTEECSYDLTFRFNVHTVERHNDTIVYCYEDGSQVMHKWDGHRQPWMQEQGQPDKTRKRFNDSTNPLKFNRDKNKLIVYELTDTLLTSGCHIVYRQTVLMMPPYSTSEMRDPISSEEYFEWQGVLWVGDKVNTATVSNPNHLPIGVLREYGMTPPTDGWVVEYFAGNYTYALTTTTQTRPRHREDGTLTAVCDSTVQLLVQVGEVQREKSYDYTCSSEIEYIWYAGGITPDTIWLNDFEGKDYTKITDSITIHKGRYDLLTSTAKRRDKKDPWPVAGMPAEFDHYLTIFPAYIKAYDTIVCQDPGKTVIFKEMEFPLDDFGVLEDKNDAKKTKPKTWIHPETLEEFKVECDSGEMARVFIEPIYNDYLNREMATDKRYFYTHDTLRFFTDPAVLFVGSDFFITHPHIADLDELKAKAGVDSIVYLDKTLVPDLARTDVDWRVHTAFYSCDQLAPNGSRVLDINGKPLGCDSTSYLELYIKKAIIHDPVNMGDNGHICGDDQNTVWSFGGDTTTSVTGSKRETFPFTTGEYFSYYYDDDGNIIGSVPFDEEDGATRRNAGQNDVNYSENDDGTRTYLFIDSVWNDISGMYDVHIQAVTVYPTYVIDYLKKKVKAEGGIPDENNTIMSVCADDVFPCPWDPSQTIEVAKLERKNRIAYYADTLYQKHYQPVKVDSIIYLRLMVYGNSPTVLTHPHCFNDPPYQWRNVEGLPVNATVYYDPLQLMKDTLLDTIMTADGLSCKDYLTLIVKWQPAYGIEEFKGKSKQFDRQYIEPYETRNKFCQNDPNPHWILEDGTEHIPTNLYDADGNKIPDNKIPTDMAASDDYIYIVRDSLETVGCFCDSVLTLYYMLTEAPKEIPKEIRACEKEVVHFEGLDIPIEQDMENPMYVEIPNGTSCPDKYILTFIIDELSRFKEVEAGPICYDDVYDYTTYQVYYKFTGPAPQSYSIYYSQEAKDSLHIKSDLENQTVPYINMDEWSPEKVYTLDVRLPAIPDKTNYPTPGIYDATIGFNNGNCSSDEFMSYPLKLDVRYPEWIMEQRHGDLIVLLDSVDNGHRTFSGFQWYKDGRKLEGYIKPYLYIPGGLEVGASYYVELTETNAQGDTITTSPTCPIIAEAAPNGGNDSDLDHGPTGDYLSVTPTCVPLGRTIIHILAHDEHSSGTYRVSTIEGQYVSSGEFHGQATPINIPAVEGMYVVQVRSNNKEAIESYRSIKVVVGDLCQE